MQVLTQFYVVNANSKSRVDGPFLDRPTAVRKVASWFRVFPDSSFDVEEVVS